MKINFTNVLLFLFLCIGWNISLFAQCTYLVPISGNNTIVASSGSICDNGGTSNYSLNSNGYTIISPLVNCQAVSLSFTAFSTENGADFLTIYDGVGLSGAVLYGPASGSPALTTITSLTGSLTVLFTSNATVSDIGFSADISNVALVLPAPSPVTATPTSFCNGATVQLNATTTGTSINWYTAPTGGTSLGSSLSGANFGVTPSGTTTYYAEAMFPGGGLAPGSQTFNFTGSVQTFTVPTGVTSITIDARGAQGANALDRLTTNATGGMGGRAQGALAVTPGQVLNIYVGGQGNTNGNGGFNGGGNGGLSNAGGSCSGGYAGGGGGASDIRAGGTALGNRVIVAAGGGGVGRDYCNGSCQPCGCGGSGGAGGGLIGVNGVAAGNCGFSYPGSGVNGGFAGTQAAGGAGAPGDGGGVSGTAGILGIGGAGATGDYDVSGGGGGGGYYGGGGGGGASSGSGVAGGGGGGGSSYITGLIGGSTTQGFQTGNGQVIISWSGSSGCPSPRTPVTVTLNATTPSAPTSVTATPSTISCSGATVSLSAISLGNTIQWYTVPTGGTNIGTSASGANFAVPVTGTTTYYAEVLSACNGLVSVTRVPVTVAFTPPPAPSPVTATPTTFCNGATVQLNATTTGTSINWYTVPTGGTSLGSSLSGANFGVTPSGTTTYYAEAMFPGGGPAPGSQTFNFTGSVQTFTVPTGVTSITIDAKGAQGANALDRLTTNATGGMGGRAQGALAVTPGQVLNIYVGGQGNTNGNGGFNGGGNGGLSNPGSTCFGGYAGGGGGASDIRAGGTALVNRVVVAAGGGGAGRDYCNGTCQPCGCGGSGGAGGGLTGVNGVAAGNCGFSYPGSGVNGGFAGTQAAGGAGALGDGGGVSGTAGVLGIGGAGATGDYDVSGGGGGGGYYGGGGGGGASSGSGVAAGGGGGGSSYITGLTGGSTTQGFQTGNGQIIISWSGSSGCPSARTPITVTLDATTPSAPTSVTATPSTISCSGATVSLSAISLGNTIQWYTVPTGGTNIGTSASGANFAVTPSGTTTYYAEVLSACNGLVSATRVPVTVTLSLPAPTPVTATPSVACPGATVQLNGTTTGTSINWYTVPTGGTPFGVSASGANVPVVPPGTITYYAEAMFPGGGPAPGSQTFNYTGSVQTFTVPTGVTSITIDARGAQGANALDRLTTNATGGMGGRAQGALTVTPGQVLNIYVGGQGNTNGNGGFNGGGNGGLSTAGSTCFGGYAGGGGGASDIRAGGTALANRVVVAAGGGGAGRDYCNGTCQPCGCGGSGGAGGGLTGVNGVAAGNCGFSYPGSGVNGGFAGTQAAGGAGAPGDGGGVSGTAGVLGLGGAGATGNYDVSGGGGGGGYYGGGGGGGASSGSGVAAGGGGGGSSYITGLTGGSTTQGFQTGDGQIIISWSGSSGCPSARTPVTVSIPSAPTITCPASQTLNLNVSCGSTLVDFTTLATTTGPAPITVSQFPIPTSSVSGTGLSTVTLTATDACNRTATCSFTVNKVDNTAPVMPSLSSLTGQCTITATAPTTSDNCAGTVTGTTTSPLTYNSQGTYSIIWSFNDGNGNITTATQSVVVDDVTAPITPTLAPINTQCGATITPPTTSDNCVGTITGSTTSPLTYNSQGTYSVVWTFDDGNGNSTTATQSVIVDDVTAPITPTLATATGQCSLTVIPPTTTDNCAGTVTGSTTSPLTYNSQGTYSILWTFNDGNGNTTTATQSVVVDDATAPVPNIATLPTLSLPCGGVLTAPSATDNCAGAIIGTTGTMTYNLPGTFTVTWTYDDGNGNITNQTQTVVVSGGVLTIGSNSPICTGADLNLTASGSGTYSWTGPNGFTSSVQNPVITSASLLASGTYNVTASTGPGCNASTLINVYVGPITLAVNPDPIDSTLAHAIISNCTSPYTLYWRRIITGSAWSNLSTIGNTPDITGLLPATAYVAYAVDANGATTDLVYFITAGNPSCGFAPTLTAFVNCDKIFADWSSGVLYSQYAISFRQVAPVLGPTASAYTAITSKVYTITPANFGSTYEVFVAGYCDNQFSVVSAPAYVTVTDPRPGAPVGLTFSATCNSITTNWPSVPGAVGYFVKIRNPISNSILVNQYTTNITYTRFGLVSNFTYEIWVTPVGCSNLQGTESQHFMVQSCTGNAIGIRAQNPNPSYNSSDDASATDWMNEGSLSVYPNPNNGSFTVTLGDIREKSAVLEVVNMLGQVVYKEIVNTEQGILNRDIQLVNEIALGTYLVRVSTEKQTYLAKFVKTM